MEACHQWRVHARPRLGVTHGTCRGPVERGCAYQVAPAAVHGADEVAVQVVCLSDLHSDGTETGPATPCPATLLPWPHSSMAAKLRVHGSWGSLPLPPGSVCTCRGPHVHGHSQPWRADMCACIHMGNIHALSFPLPCDPVEPRHSPGWLPRLLCSGGCPVHCP